jgi:hypothetical protein
VSLRRDQLILVNKAVNEKEQLEKGLEEEEENKTKKQGSWTTLKRSLNHTLTSGNQSISDLSLISKFLNRNLLSERTKGIRQPSPFCFHAVLKPFCPPPRKN